MRLEEPQEDEVVKLVCNVRVTTRTQSLTKLYLGGPQPHVLPLILAPKVNVNVKYDHFYFDL